MSTGISSILGYWSKTVVMEGCSPRIHCCLAAAVLDIAPRMAGLSVAGSAKIQSILSLSTSASLSSCDTVSPHGRSQVAEKKTFRFTVLIK